MAAEKRKQRHRIPSVGKRGKKKRSERKRRKEQERLKLIAASRPKVEQLLALPLTDLCRVIAANGCHQVIAEYALDRKMREHARTLSDKELAALTSERNSPWPKQLLQEELNRRLHATRKERKKKSRSGPKKKQIPPCTPAELTSTGMQTGRQTRRSGSRLAGGAVPVGGDLVKCDWWRERGE